MKPLFLVGLVVLILGVVAFVIPIPRTGHEGVRIGGVGIGVETHTQETLPPIVGGLMIVAGAVMMIAQQKLKT